MQKMTLEAHPGSYVLRWRNCNVEFLLYILCRNMEMAARVQCF